MSAMRCERIQELILTDHMDKELDEKGRREVDAHVSSCASCRQFQREALKRASEPFRLAQAEEAPSYIWERVKRRIAAGAAEEPGLLLNTAGLLRRVFSPLLKIPKPAIAFAATAAIIIAVIMARPATNKYGAYEYLNEQMDFMTSLDLAEANGNGVFDTDINTGVENIL